jgi:stage II sporulation protein AA (anti-sigma F factor antagonist)
MLKPANMKVQGTTLFYDLNRVPPSQFKKKIKERLPPTMMMMINNHPTHGNTSTEEVYATHTENNCNVIHVQIDSFDHRYIETFKSAINHCLVTDQKKVVLNLKAVNFMDSAGLGIVLYGHRACKQAGGQFMVCEASGYVNKLFGLTGVAKAVQLFDTLEDALQI